jgi:hypothetical protein
MVQVLKRKGTVYALVDILELSKGGNAYKWVCSKMMQCVVGYSKWQRRCFKEHMSEFTTDSDESFLVVVIENNYQRWLDEAQYLANNTSNQAKTTTKPANEDIEEQWKENLAPAKYTNAGMSASNSKGSNRRCGGWSKEGYKRFNALYAMVKEDRKRRVEFELDLKEMCQDERNMDEAQNDDDDDSDDEEIIPANDMVGVKQPEASLVAAAACLDTYGEDDDEEEY